MATTATARKKSKEKSLTNSLGLDSIGDLSGLLDTDVSNGPLMLDMNLIDEDPNQPRSADNPGFSKASLEELASTIEPRGVKSPISVRENPDQPGRYIINHGARRYRASKLAKREAIPAFVDNDYLESDQVIENLQRNELTAREIADFIGRELAKGKKKIEIAKSIGKSPAFVSQHVTLLDLPDFVADAFNTGRTKDVTVVNELVTAFKKDPEKTKTWFEKGQDEITRPAVKELREFIDTKQEQEEALAEVEEDEPDQIQEEEPKALEQASEPAEAHVESAPQTDNKPKSKDSSKIKKAIVQVVYSDRAARLVLDKRPTSEGLAWLKFDDGDESEVELKEVQLKSIIEA